MNKNNYYKRNIKDDINSIDNIVSSAGVDDEHAPMRLQKFISLAGKASRRSAEKTIEEGRVRVNGKPVSEMGVKIIPSRDLVEIDHVKLTIPAGKRYYLLYKPRGYLSTVSDPEGRPTVMDLFPPELRKGLFPVGRLDLDTEGLLLMTSDGELTNYLTHPRFMVKKTYHAWVRGIPGPSELQQLNKGISTGGETYAPAEAKLLASNIKPEKAKLQISLFEGKKRQIRNMCKAINHPVLSLKRVSLAFLNLAGLKPGAYRPLKKEEVKRLFKTAKL